MESRGCILVCVVLSFLVASSKAQFCNTMFQPCDVTRACCPIPGATQLACVETMPNRRFCFPQTAIDNVPSTISTPSPPPNTCAMRPCLDNCNCCPTFPSCLTVTPGPTAPTTVTGKACFPAAV